LNCETRAFLRLNQQVLKTEALTPHIAVFLREPVRRWN